MSEDFFYALITGWAILLVFWGIIIVFILVRKPPKSKLTKKITIYSLIIFIIIFMLLNLLNNRFGF